MRSPRNLGPGCEVSPLPGCPIEAPEESVLKEEVKNQQDLRNHVV